MADARDELYEVFDRGHPDDGASLSDRDRELYRIQFFLLEFEMGSWPANWMGEWERMDATIAAMRKRGLIELAVVVQQQRDILHRGADFYRELEQTGQSVTWYEILDRIDPEGGLDALDDLIRELDDYGLPDHWQTHSG